jgi:peroxiredoxin
MKTITRYILSITAFFCATVNLHAEQPVAGDRAPEFTLNNALGQPVSLNSFNAKTLVLEWFNPGCPFVKKFYSKGDMPKFQGQALELGAVWLTINSSAPGKQGHISADEAVTVAKDSGINPERLLLDPEGKVGRAYGAKTTPHIFVIDSKGILAYTGAIDNTPSTSSNDIAQASNYALSAVKALASDSRPNPANTESYGCSVKY